MARIALPKGRWEELASRAHFNAKDLAALCTISVRQLERMFRSELRRSPQDWLNERRIIAAQQLLLSGKLVKVVALELHFKQTSHFCRHFKLFTHTTASAYISALNQMPRAVANR